MELILPKSIQEIKKQADIWLPLIPLTNDSVRNKNIAIMILNGSKSNEFGISGNRVLQIVRQVLRRAIQVHNHDEFNPYRHLSVRALNCFHNKINYGKSWDNRIRKLTTEEFMNFMAYPDNILLRWSNFGKVSLLECRALEYKIKLDRGENAEKPEKPRQHQNKQLRQKCNLGPKVHCEGKSISSGGECQNYASVILEGKAYCRVHGGDVAIDIVLRKSSNSIAGS